MTQEEALGRKLREVIRQIVREELDKASEGKPFEADLPLTKVAMWKQWQDYLQDVEDAARASGDAFRREWDNDKDAMYDNL